MKTLLIILLSISCYSQSDLDKYVIDYNECRGIQITDVLKEINYARLEELQKAYRIYLEVEKDSLYHFTLLINPLIKNKRKVVFEALDEIVKESLLISEVKQTF